MIVTIDGQQYKLITYPSGAVVRTIYTENYETTTTVMSKLSFIQKFTQAERITIRASTDPVIIDFMELLSMAQEIDLEYPDTIAGLNYMETIGLLGAGRAAEILGG